MLAAIREAAIRDDHIRNHFNDKFVSLDHVGYFY